MFLLNLFHKEKEPEHLACTYCGGTSFFMGPTGGLSQNILCSNPVCRHWFNHYYDQLDDLHRQEEEPNA